LSIILINQKTLSASGNSDTVLEVENGQQQDSDYRNKKEKYQIL
jgi:hypothetical protein